MSPPPQSSPLSLAVSLQENSLMALFLFLFLSLLSSGSTNGEGEGDTGGCKAALARKIHICFNLYSVILLVLF